MLGIAAGNYACSLIYRLPINEPLFEKHPFCGSCKTFLKPKDLFPLFSWLWLKGKCRYCGSPIPAIYTVTEIVYAMLFCLGYLKFGHTENFILFLIITCFATILGAIGFKKSYVEFRVLWVILAASVILRTYLDHSIYGALGGGFALGLAGLAGWRLALWKTKSDSKKLPAEVFLLVTAGMCLGFLPGMLFLLTFGAGYLAIRVAYKELDYMRLAAPWWATMLIVQLFLG